MNRLFAKGVLPILIGLSVVSLGAMVWSAVLGDTHMPAAVGANAYSRSADGHHAFVELLERLDIETLTSRYDTARRVDGANVLVAIEPEIDDRGSFGLGRLEQSFTASTRAILVLPKRRSTPDLTHPGWIAGAEPAAAGRIESMLKSLGLLARIVRPAVDPAPGDWSGALALAAPEIDGVQLLERTPDIEPLLECRAGVLIGRIALQKRRVIVLTDPDLLNNAGLGRGANAKIAMRALDEIRPGDGVVVIDESIHGAVRRPSIWRELFAFPMVVGVIQAVLVCGIYLWAGLGRFGKPLVTPRNPPRGKRALIDNVADLLLYGGRRRFVIGRYQDLCVRDAARAVHVADAGDRAGLLQALARIGAARGVTDDILVLTEEVRAAEMSSAIAARRSPELAKRLDRWRKEMLGES